MGKNKKEGISDKDRPSIVEIWHRKYKEATANLPSWEKQCLELLRQPIEQAVRRILARVDFRSTLNVEEVVDAFVYEELLFYLFTVRKMYEKFREGLVEHILGGHKISDAKVERTV